MSWLEDELGIDPGDLLEFGGTLIDLWDDWETKEVNDAAARFTRGRQILDIAAFVGEQTRLREINTARAEWMNISQRAVLEGTRDYARAEADYWSGRAQAELDMGYTRAVDDAVMRERDFRNLERTLETRGAQIAANRLNLGAEYAELDVGQARIAAQRLSLGVDRAQVGVGYARIAAQRQQMGHERVEIGYRQQEAAAREDALGAERRLLESEAAERGQILEARRQAQQAGLQAVQARQAQVRGVGQMRTTARMEEAQMAGGAVAAGAAARGITGSFEGTAGRQIGREAARDVAEIGLGVRSEMASLAERQAGLMLEGQRIVSEGRMGFARDEAARAGLRAQQRGISAEQAGLRGQLAMQEGQRRILDAEAAGLQAQAAAVEGQEGVLTAQLAGLQAQRTALGGRAAVFGAQEAEIAQEQEGLVWARDISDRQLFRDQTRTALTGAQTSLRGAAAELDTVRAVADLGDLDLDISQLGAEITSGDTAIAIANWTLSAVPELPDTDVFFLRSALGTLLGSGQSRWGE